MAEIEDGGNAFPFIGWKSPDGMYAAITHHGMTLRDYFAAAALTGILADGGGESWRKDAENAYFAADAMLSARKVGDG